MKHGFGKLQVPKVARALGHVCCTSFTLHLPINSTKPRVAQSSNLWFAPFRRLTMFNLHHRHLPLQTKPSNNKFGNYIYEYRNQLKSEPRKRFRFPFPSVSGQPNKLKEVEMVARITISSGLSMPN